MKMQGGLFLILVGAISIFSCRKPDALPPEPIIEFIDFKQTAGDSAWLIISFQDGDGDLGFYKHDTLSNIFLRYFEVNNGNSEEVILPDAFSFKMPDITPEGRNKALTGEIWILLNYYYDPGSTFDAIRYRVKIVDRAGNFSNEVETPDIFVEP